MKRKKDGGFTLIELMIVIAVIGILAVVLVPKVGTIKTQAKGAGIDTNMRMVEGYVQSRISSWGNANSITSDNIATELENSFNQGSDKIKNPFTPDSASVSQGAVAAVDENPALYILDTSSGTDETSASETKGTIVVSPNLTAGNKLVSIIIYAHDASGSIMTDKTVTITP